MSAGFEFRLAIEGNLRKYMEEEYARGQQAVTRAMKDVGERAKQRLRDQVTGAGMGQRLANSWRLQLYPRGRASINAAAWIYSNAEHIILAFNEGMDIRAKRRKWLAIPTDKVGGKGQNRAAKFWGLRRNSGKFRARNIDLVKNSLGISLRFVPLKNGNAMLVAPEPRRGKKKGPAKEVVYFWLVKQVRMPKRLSVQRVARQADAELVPAVLREWKSGETNGQP
jgi:hypothetical protein